jgi:hypothetical protein
MNMKPTRPDSGPRHPSWRAAARVAILAAVVLAPVAGWIFRISLALSVPILALAAALALVAGGPAPAAAFGAASFAAAVVYDCLWPSSGPYPKHLGGTKLATPEFDRTRCYMEPR